MLALASTRARKSQSCIAILNLTFAIVATVQPILLPMMTFFIPSVSWKNLSIRSRCSGSITTLSESDSLPGQFFDSAATSRCNRNYWRPRIIDPELPLETTPDCRNCRAQRRVTVPELAAVLERQLRALWRVFCYCISIISCSDRFS